MKNSDWILYYSQKWLNEEINQRGLKNEHQLYRATQHDRVTNRSKDIEKGANVTNKFKIFKQ